MPIAQTPNETWWFNIEIHLSQRAISQYEKEIAELDGLKDMTEGQKEERSRKVEAINELRKAIEEIKNSDKATWFKLKALSREEYNAYRKARDSHIVDGEDVALSYGLIDWKNFRDEDDNEIPFDKDAKLEYLYESVSMVLFVAILERNKIEEQESKNSESPVTS